MEYYVKGEMVPAQNLNQDLLSKISYSLAVKRDDGTYDLPTLGKVVDALEHRAKRGGIRFGVMHGRYGYIYLFYNDRRLLDDLKINGNIYLNNAEAKTKEKEEIPVEISTVKNLFELHTKEFSSGSCIYFLCKNRKVVYVGKTINIYQRIISHLSSEKVFNHVYYMLIPGDKLSRVEFAIIQYLKPVYNSIPAVTNTKLKEKYLRLAKSVLIEQKYIVPELSIQINNQ